WYCTPTQRAHKPLWESVQVRVCWSRCSSSFCDWRSSFHWPRNSDEGRPPYLNEKGGCVEASTLRPTAGLSAAATPLNLAATHCEASPSSSGETDTAPRIEMQACTANRTASSRRSIRL